MSTFVIVNTYTHAVTYVTDKLLTSIKTIIRESGLSPEKFSSEWTTIQAGVTAWLTSQHLECLILEVYNPKTDGLVGRWDFEIFYGYQGDGAFWIDPDAIKYHILKQGVWPVSCEYRLVATTKAGRPGVAGWSSTALRSTDGLVRQSIGTSVNGSGLSSGTGYWRKATS